MQIEPTTREVNGLFYACYLAQWGNYWGGGRTFSLRLVSSVGTTQQAALGIASAEVERIKTRSVLMA